MVQSSYRFAQAIEKLAEYIKEVLRRNTSPSQQEPQISIVSNSAGTELPVPMFAVRTILTTMRRKSLSSLTKRFKTPPAESKFDALKATSVENRRFVQQVNKANDESTHKIETHRSEGNLKSYRNEFKAAEPSCSHDQDVASKTMRSISRQLRKMSVGELDILVNSEDNFLVDCLLDQVPAVKKSLTKRDTLEAHVQALASYNYAREPEFVRDRINLREQIEQTNAIRRRIVHRYVDPIMHKLGATHEKLTKEAREAEEQSECLAKKYLDGELEHQAFIEQYMKIREVTSQKRTLADRLTKERNKLAEQITKPFELDSPVPVPRRKRVSFQTN